MDVRRAGRTQRGLEDVEQRVLSERDKVTAGNISP